MVQTVSLKVPFTTANVSKCLCPKCPVQANSSCVSEKLPKLGDALKQTPLRAANIPAVYCSTGKATCQDLDAKASCICGGCAVYTSYQLATARPAIRYCKNGGAR